MSFPFLFYGAHPAEWYGGGRLDYEVRFVTTPVAADRVAIAAAVRARLAALAEIRLDAYDPWRWAEAWTALVVRTRTSETDWTIFFEEVAELFRTIHGACAIELVVCRSVDTAPGEDDPWTVWTLATRPDIGARPRWDAKARTSQDRFAARGPRLPIDATFDPSFEAARNAAE